MTAHIRSPRRLAPDRAPRLRRFAEHLDAQAAGATDPNGVRELAREMRLRAALLECGEDSAVEASELDEEIAALAFESA